MNKHAQHTSTLGGMLPPISGGSRLRPAGGSGDIPTCRLGWLPQLQWRHIESSEVGWAARWPASWHSWLTERLQASSNALHWFALPRSLPLLSGSSMAVAHHHPSHTAQPWVPPACGMSWFHHVHPCPRGPSASRRLPQQLGVNGPHAKMQGGWGEGLTRIVLPKRPLQTLPDQL